MKFEKIVNYLAKYESNESQKYLIDILLLENNKNIINIITNDLNKINKTCFVLPHLGMGDQINLNGFVRLLSYIYLNVTLVVKNNTITNIKYMYSDLNNVNFYLVNNDSDISPRFSCDYNKYMNITKEYDDIFLLCLHSLDKYHLNTKIFTDIPFCFYRQYGFDKKSFWLYFKIHTKKEIEDELKSYKILFFHNQSSQGKIFNIEKITDKLNINLDDYIIINPDSNYYNDDSEKKYICEKYIGRELFSYSNIIINSAINIVSDSAFMCLAINLKIKTKKNYYISRNNRNYDYLWEDDIYKKLERKQFFQIIM